MNEIVLSASFEPDPQLTEALLAAARPGVTCEVVFDRPWRERILSWPWRPWHNERVYELFGSQLRYADPGNGDYAEVELSADIIKTRTRHA